MKNAVISPKLNCFHTPSKIIGIHATTRYTLMISRCIGLFPVSGLLCTTDVKLRSPIKSIYTIVCTGSLLGQIVVTVLGLINLFAFGSGVRSIYKCAINMSGLISTLLSFSLARRWPRLVHNAAMIERILPTSNHKNLITICNAITTFVFLGSLVDIALSTAFYLRVSVDCYENYSTMESFYKYTMPWASPFIPYSPWALVILQILYIQIVIVANLTDTFIVVLSLYLTSYFEGLHDLVFLYKDKYPSMWSILRGHYTKLTHLVKLVDDNISALVLFSFGSNLTLICVQLFKILRKDLAHDLDHCNQDKIKETLESPERIAYFSYSILFLITRAVITAVSAARLHTTARAPINVLYEVPTSSYTLEAHRLLEQIHGDTIALSGLHFFYVTRKMILKMMATIITYQIVLLQFSDSSYMKKTYLKEREETS